MHPILFKLGPVTIYTYGFFIALGILVALILARKEAERVGIDPQRIMDLGFYLVIAGIIGSRLFYVATAPGYYLRNPLEIFKIWNGGLVFYGAFIAALIVALVYFKKYKLPMWKSADTLAPSVAVAHAIGRLGCFSAGCCYGKVCHLPWAATFNNPNTLARPIGVPLHPTQLYSSLSNFLIFIVLISIRRRMKFNGQLFWIYIIIYGVARSIIEIFRGDFRGGLVFNLLTVSQTIGLSMAFLGICMLIILGRKSSMQKKNNG